MLQKEHYLPSYLCDGTDLEKLLETKEDKFHFLYNLAFYFQKVVTQEAIVKHMVNISDIHYDYDGTNSVFLHTSFVTCEGEHEIQLSMMMDETDGDGNWDFNIQVLGSVEEEDYTTGGIYEEFLPIADDIYEEFKDFVLEEIDDPIEDGQYSYLILSLKNMLPAYIKCMNIIDQRIKEVEAE